MDDDDVVTQLGLILTQLRIVRLTVEQIERDTARYGNFVFATAMAAGPKFGEPPLFEGALRVYVVNIEDLAPGGGFGSFLEAVLGGAGRFLGGFVGGVGGGAISAAALPFIVGDLAKIADKVDSILERLGIGKQVTEPAKKGEKDKDKVPPSPGLDLKDTLKSLEETLKIVTKLFEAASAEGPKKETGKAIEPAVTDRWTAMLKLAHTLLTDIEHVVNGLIILIPIFIGALAWLISKLDVLKVAFLELLQFILRNALLLRGVVLAVLFDTIAAAAKLAHTVIDIVAGAVKDILESLFKIIGAVLTVAVEGLKIIASAVAAIVNALSKWMAGPLMELLERIANSLLFRFLMHVVRVLPALLPPLYELMREKGDKAKGIPESPPLTSKQLLELKAAGRMSMPSATAFAGATKKITDLSFPDLLGPKVIPPGSTGDITKLPTLVADQGKIIQDEAANVFKKAGDAVTKLETALKNAATEGEKKFNEALDKHIATATAAADTLAKALDPVIAKAKEKKETGLEIIAQKYEEWVTKGGMNLVLKNVDEHFKSSTIIPKEIIEAGKADEKVPVTVEIQDMVIEIDVPSEKEGGAEKEKAELDAEGPIPAQLAELEKMGKKMLEFIHHAKQRGAENFAAAKGEFFALLNMDD